GFISVECSSDADPELEALNIKGKIDQILSELRQTIKNLPYAKVTVNNPYILKLALCGPLNPEELRTIAKKQIVPQLKNVNGVAEVSIVGGKEREIQINLYKHRLDGLKLSFQAVAAIVAAQTATITGGDISGDYKKYSVRVKGELESIDQIKNIGVPVFSKSDTISVPLYTIAEIKDSYKETREVARFDGKNAIGISVVKKNKNGIIAVSDSVHLLINQINRILPSGTTIHTVLDQADSIRDSVKKISVNMLLGTGLIALVLFILLGSWRIAFIVALIIPVSISITASGIQFLKLTFNPVSFIAIPYAASVIFANVIIVVESILKNLNGKNATKESVVHCTSEVIKIIITMVLFNVAVFLPIIMAKDITGHAFKSLGWIIIISSVVSAFLSLTIIPLTVSKIMVSHKGSRPVRILSIISSVYMKMLRFAIRLKYGVVFLMIILLICTAYFFFPQTAMMLFPSEDSGIIKVSIKMVPGTTQHEGDRTIKIIEDKLMHISELKSTFSTSDSSKIYTGTDFIDITVLLNDKKTRRKTAKIIAKDIRLLLADIPDAEINVNVFNPTGTQGSGSDITIE
ncbi:MAG: efflux RND transporter permease subunit, partial [Fibrobacter sp.]|nr:efflux RND transporter permease subunit [Fibrobacter sp.]